MKFLMRLNCFTTAFELLILNPIREHIYIRDMFDFELETNVKITLDPRVSHAYVPFKYHSLIELHNHHAYLTT